MVVQYGTYAFLTDKARTALSDEKMYQHCEARLRMEYPKVTNVSYDKSREHILDPDDGHEIWGWGFRVVGDVEGE